MLTWCDPLRREAPIPQDFLGGAKGILVILGIAALFALGGSILFVFEARFPTLSSAPSHRPVTRADDLAGQRRERANQVIEKQRRQDGAGDQGEELVSLGHAEP